MNELKKEIRKNELFDAIQGSIADGQESIRKLAEAFRENINALRIEDDEEVFAELTQNFQDLQMLMSFIAEIREGMTFFDSFGLPEDPVMSENAGLNLLKEMHEAMVSRDWILLSDLVEYELAPLLIKEIDWFQSLEERMDQQAPQDSSS